MTPDELADRGDLYASETSWTEHGDWLVNHWPEIAAALRQADADRARLATAEQIIGYSATPTMAWNPSKGPIEEYVLVADEHLVRSALRAIIWNAQRFQREQP